MYEDEEKPLYAKVISSSQTPLTLNDLTYFPTDYILRCMDGPYEGRQLRLKDLGNDITIGDSDSCELSIKFSNLEEKHCRLKYIKNSIYYNLEDCNTKSGTWKKILNMEEAFEVTQSRTEFIIFHYRFIIYENKGKHFIKFLEGSSQLKDTEKVLCDEGTLTIGKKGCVITLTDLKCSENHEYRIVKTSGRIFVINATNEPTNEGVFYRIHPDEVTLIRAGDLIRVGNSTFRILVHNWGVTSEIGNRKKQEDKYCVIDDLRIFEEICVPFYSVYDGHGGITCSLFLSKHFHKNLRDIIKLKKLEKSLNILYDLTKAIQEAIIYTDFAYYETDLMAANHGSTCVFCIFIANKIICCNLGDSISILYKKDNQRIYLSKDFRPLREKESERIKMKKGFVANERMLGLISVSRGFGDWKYKDSKKPENMKKLNVSVNFDDYLMSNRAEFRIFEIDPETCDYVIIVSDGIFAHAKKQFVFDIINKYQKQERGESGQIINVPAVADNVRLEIINTIYVDEDDKENNLSADNMTLIIINLHMSR